MQKSTAFLLAAVGFLAGVITGFMVAPVKKGICIDHFRFGCNNGNSYAKSPENDESFDDNGFECDEEGLPF